MELYKLIPEKQKHLSEWSTNGEYVLFKKIHNIPICYYSDGIVWVFLDLRIQKEILWTIKHLMDSEIKFYFTHPEFSNPGEEFVVEKVIYQYLRAIVDTKFNKGIKKINFDIVKNLSDWTNEFSSYELLKDCYDDFSKIVKKDWFDYFSKKKVYDYPENIRDEYRVLWREIQINNIL